MKRNNTKVVFLFVCAIIVTFVVALSLNFLSWIALRETLYFIQMTSLPTYHDCLRRLVILVLVFLGGAILWGKIEIMLSGAVAICLAPTYKKWFAIISVTIVYFSCWCICCIEDYCLHEGVCIRSVSDFVAVAQDMALGMPLYQNGVMVKRGPSMISWFYYFPLSGGILQLLYIAGQIVGYIAVCKRGGSVTELFRKDWVIGRICCLCVSKQKTSKTKQVIEE